MWRLSILVAVLVAAGQTPGLALAQELDLSGSVAAEVRLFLAEGRFEGQLQSFQGSLVLESEVRYRTANRNHLFVFKPFARLDGQDPQRTHFDIREAYWRGILGGAGEWEIVAGIDRVFWGVTESRHLVDVINQIDFLEDIDEEDKLGQPMIRVEWQRPWGRLSGFLLLGFRERRFPGPDGRLRFPLPVAEDQPIFEDSADGTVRPVDLALRYSHFLGDFDVGLHVFNGTSREPAFYPDRDVAPPPFLIPVYRVITQLGADVQYTRDAWLWKLETIVREGEGATFAAAVAGFEYTLYQLGGSSADLGLLAEYLYDGRDDSAPPTIFDNDLFVGSRLALNDVQNTSLLAGAVIDLEDGTVAGRVEAERRLGEHIKLELESRFFVNVDGANFLRFFRNDSFVTLRLGLHF